ncbi:hypothetical protein FRB94_003871 [Tulasnella sp. JGI-2019a]|nr:hypothetical protein FRB94_003871 [Tulasnella sp. JGI-2019a]
MSSLIGEIRERSLTNISSIKPQGKFDPATGFPTVQHRSKSAFAKGRDAARAATTATTAVPAVRATEKADSPEEVDSGSVPTTGNDNLADAAWRKGMSDQNDARIQQMSQAEREREAAELSETFGPGLLELVRKAKRRRGDPQHHVNGTDQATQPDATLPPKEDKARELDLKLHTSGLHAPFHGSRPSSPLPSAIRSSTSTPKPGASNRKKIQFSTEPAAVHVYESAPTSPKRRPIALLGPPDPDHPSKNQLTYSASTFLKNSRDLGVGEVRSGGGRSGEKDRMEVDLADEDDPDVGADGVEQEQEQEGSPEYIRKRYFPTAAANEPTLEWMKARSTPTTNATGSSSVNSTTSTTRYDLAGQPITASLQTSLPTHLGLHHHGGDQDQAGYTIEDLLLLSRSTVPAQRASMLAVLGKVLLNTRSGESDDDDNDLRSRVLAAGLDAMMEKGSVGIRAVEILWIALVRCASKVEAGGKVTTTHELLKDDSLDIATLVPPSILLGRISTLLHPTTRALPQESLAQLLDVLVHLVSRTAQGRDVATDILRTQGLIQGVMMAFLTPSISTPSDPNPRAIILLDHIARVSRANAKQIVDDGMADACLRFLVALSEDDAGDHPSTAPQSEPSAHPLLVETMRLFTTLGKYGMYTNIATDVHQNLTHHALTLSPTAVKADLDLSRTYLELLEIWITCAVDPHRTTPPHDILWSQVVGWAWVEDVLRFRRSLFEREDSQGRVLGAVWNVLAAWIEGCGVNSVRAGQGGREVLVKELMGCVAKEEVVLERAVKWMIEKLGDVADGLEGVESLVHLSEDARLVGSAIRLAYALEERHSDGEASRPVMPSSTLTQLRTLCQGIAASAPLTAYFNTSTTSISQHALIQPITNLLATSITLLERTIPPDEWLQLAIRSATCFIPGDEDFTASIFSLISKNVTEALVVKQWGWSDIPSDVWTKGGLRTVLPFLFNSTKRHDVLEGGAEGEEAPLEVVAPYTTTPKAIEEVTTMVVPAPQSKTASRSNSTPGLPLRNDWPFVALNDLLHSGTSPVFHTLPDDWDHSEVDIVRGTLLWASVAQHVTLHISDKSVDGRSLMTREEMVFGCMKVFMLEHGQSSASSAGNDSSSEVFRDEGISKSMDRLLLPFRIGQSTSTYSTTPPPSLEITALPFLGISTPFFQFYSDFLGLYDSVSFGHSTFGSLLLPPLANANYAADYRKLLWGDYPQVLRLLDFEVQDVIGDDARRWLWPIETDGEMIGMYLKALGRGFPRGFLRWIAVHHLACNIWPDLGTGDETIELRRRKLLNAVLGSTGLEVVRDVILYHQLTPESGPVVLPPQCFEEVGGWRVERLEWAVSWGGASMRARLTGLLDPAPVTN